MNQLPLTYWQGRLNWQDSYKFVLFCHCGTWIAGNSFLQVMADKRNHWKQCAKPLFEWMKVAP